MLGDSIVTALKVSVAVAVAGAFMIVINNLIGFLADIVFGGVIGEVLKIISMCLPFNASAVFGSIATAVSAIFSFMIGSKIYELTSSWIQL